MMNVNSVLTKTNDVLHLLYVLEMKYDQVIKFRDVKNVSKILLLEITEDLKANF